MKVVHSTLEVTKERLVVWQACKQAGDTCTGCQYRYLCEVQFPEIDIVPCDYKLSEDGKLFQI